MSDSQYTSNWAGSMVKGLVKGCFHLSAHCRLLSSASHNGEEQRLRVRK
jgi:hypothetical protein